MQKNSALLAALAGVALLFGPLTAAAGPVRMGFDVAIGNGDMDADGDNATELFGDIDNQQRQFGFALDLGTPRAGYRLHLELLDNELGGIDYDGLSLNNIVRFAAWSGQGLTLWMGPSVDVFSGELDVPGPDDMLSIAVGPALGLDISAGPALMLSMDAWFKLRDIRLEDDVSGIDDLLGTEAGLRLSLLFGGRRAGAQQ